MRAKAMEIRWHWKELCEPVLALDHHPSAPRIATAGSDNAIKLWAYEPAEDGFLAFRFVACLCRDAQPVNVVRFPPSEEHLLSGHDGGQVVLWQRAERHVVPASAFECTHGDQLHNTETWGVLRLLKGHTEDVYSLAVSPDMHFAISGSIDSTILLWELTTGKAVQKIVDHAHYVQGLTWDPLNVYFASQSSDRQVNFYVDGLKKLQPPSARTPTRKRDGRFELDTSAGRDPDLPGGPRYFRDETANTFFRRLHWSPDGLFVVTVCGQFKEDPMKDDIVNCAHVFLRGVWDQSFLCLPIPDEDSLEPVVGVRWSPVLYRPRGPGPPGPTPWVLDQYRMLFALFTVSTLFIYDTSCAAPVAQVTDLHLSTITDAAWTPDGQALLVASKDGYVSCIMFEEGELGTAWDLSSDMEDLPAALQAVKRIRDELEDERAEVGARLVGAASPAAPRTPRPLEPISSPSSRPNPAPMEEDDCLPSRSVVQTPSSLFDE